MGEYNVASGQKHVAGPKYFKLSSAKSQPRISGKGERRVKEEELSHTLVAGTFEWLSKQKRPSCKNFFGKSKRFVGGSKYDRKPAPNSYKLNTKWGDAANILKTSSSFSNFKSVYYH